MNICVRLFQLFAILGVTVLVFASTAYAEPIKQIEVRGNQRLEPQTVLSYLGVKAGDEFDSFALDEGMKDLYETGFFADVRIFKESNKLIVEVVENPIVNKVAFEGNLRIEDEELSREIQLRPRAVFTPGKAQSDVARIQEIYRRTGRFSASVEPKLITLDQNRVNVVFEISEGNKTTIRKINFINNEFFSDADLKEVVLSKETRWYRFLSSDDTYDPDRLEFDKELLRRYYLANGFVDFSVTSAVAELGLNEEDFYLTFTVFEGERFKIGTIDFENRMAGLNGEGFEEFLLFEEGEWYNNDLIQDTVDELLREVEERQVSFVNVTPKLDIDRTNNIVNVTFVFSEGRRVFVDRINITGNARTMDRVIRREFEFAEGDPFSRERLAKSEQNIKDLSFFEEVSVKAVPGSMPDRTDIDVQVSEKSTGELTLGAGFSSVDGPLADFRIRERNLLGRGQELALATVLSGRRTEFDVSFTEPYFLSRDLSATANVFHTTTDYQDESSFDQAKSGVGFRVNYPLSRYLRQTIRYRALKNDITNIDANASRFIKDQAGERKTSAIGHDLIYDTRNSKLNPTEGYTLRMSNEVAGLGGNTKFISTTLGASYFHEVAKDWVFSGAAEAGMIEGYGDDEVAINDRFFLGGNSFRGFESAGMGPRDTLTDDALGGTKYWKTTAELSFPIGMPEEYGIKGHAFSDVGSLWDLPVQGAGVQDVSNVRVAVGAGVSWNSPIGPIRVDIAAPVVKERYDSEQVFNFSFGTRF